MDKRFKCTDCNELFINRPKRINHWNNSKCTFGNGTIIKDGSTRERKYVCTDCEHAFLNKSARQHHWKTSDCTWGNGTLAKNNTSKIVDCGRFENLPNDTKFEVLDDIYSDLPDGAYFAIMEEHGVTF